MHPLMFFFLFLRGTLSAIQSDEESCLETATKYSKNPQIRTYNLLHQLCLIVMEIK